MRNKKLKVGVIYGGQSAERAVSMHTATEVKKHLDPNKYTIVPIEISATGVWPKRIPLERLNKTIDVAFVAMHGPYGEDGTIQGLLETLGVPYTFSGVLASALGMDKFRTAMLAEYVGIRTPQTVMIRKSVWGKAKKQLLADIKKLGKKIVIKPNLLGSSVGVSIIRNSLKAAEQIIGRTFKYSSEVLVQEFIEGTEITVGVLGNARPRALPLIEIVPNKKASTFYDYEAKYADGGSEHIIPARVSKSTATAIQQAAIDMHELLGCRGVTRSDFILTKSGAYFLEINTIPGMTATSLIPHAAASIKINFPQLLDKIIALALK